MTINQRIAETIDNKGLKQVDLCKKIGVAKSTMNNWLTMNRSIPAEHVVPMAEFLGVTLEYLLTGKENDRNLASNIQNSNIVQGNHATTLIVKNGTTHKRELVDQEVELLRIFNALGIKKRVTLLSYAYELEDENK